MRAKIKLLGATLTAAALAALAAVTAAAPASAATLTEVTNFGANPSNLRMYLYVPDAVAPRPGLLVAVHYCTGSGPAFHSGTQFASLADRYGYIVVYPSVTRSSQCFDVSSPQALRRDGGSDPVGIMSMVNHVRQRYAVDPARIYATGVSSGAMMTNVLLGLYPDVFSAGAAFAGVPFGCFATTNGSEWNSECANGQVSRRRPGDPLLRPGQHRAADQPAAQHSPAAHRRLPGGVRGERLEHRPDHLGDHHQHRHRRGQRLEPGFHPARWADHHRRLERLVRTGQRRGDRT